MAWRWDWFGYLEAQHGLGNGRLIVHNRVATVNEHVSLKCMKYILHQTFLLPV